ncbi:MAG: lamin tail domain-containing protein, partial [Myxococcota bacterium]|nr:lamin tail domain-containing protein [Myxococcota bacterium]
PVGAVIVTEVMQNPAAVSDNDGEWFELHNTTGSSIDLDGCELSDDDGLDHTIAGSLVVGGGGYLVLATEADPALNGGFSVDYEYGGGLNLTNGDDEVILSCGGLQIDRVGWDDGATFPDPTGASMSLAPAYLDQYANDDGAHWCEATSTFGAGDQGTPGSANDPC